MKNALTTNRLLKRRIAFLLLLLLLLPGLTGCGNRAEGLKLAEAGISTSDALARYYDTLNQDLVDIWEWEAFNSAIRGIEFSDRGEALLQQQMDAIGRRAKLARRLSSTYSALKDLSSYNASEDVKKSAEGLANAITGLPPLANIGVNPATIFGNLAGDIMNWKQSRDIKKGSDLILRTLEKVKELFNRESEAYKSIAEERGNKIENIMDYMIRNKIVLPLPLLQKVPDSFGIKLAGADQPVTNEQTIAGLVAMARVRGRRLALMSAGAADGIAQSLEQLVRNHRNFRDNYGLSLATVLSGIEKAQSYLDEINKLRDGTKK